MDWIAVVIAVMKLMTSLSGWFQERGWINAGVTQEQQDEIARTAQELMDTNKIKLKISSITAADLDEVAKEQGWLRAD